MIQRGLLLRAAIDVYLANEDGVEDHTISRTQWSLLQTLDEKILGPLAQAVRMSEGGVYPTLSLCVPLYNNILDLLEHTTKCARGTPEHIFVPAARRAKAKIAGYYNSSSEESTVATMLDPRFTLAYYSATDDVAGHEGSNAQKAKALVAFTSYMEDQGSRNEDAPDSSTAATSTPSTGYALTIYRHRPTTAGRDPAAEMQKFMSEEPLIAPGAENPPTDPTALADWQVWWVANKARYPRVARMATDYLAVPGTSASSERVFSCTRHILTEFRHSLTPETVRACVCLKSWLPPVEPNEAKRQRIR